MYYIATQGLGTGSHNSGAYAEIIIDYIYKTVISKSLIKPLLLSTYVDDAWLIWPGTKESFLEFKESLNKLWPTINFTHEYSTDEKLTFLDMKTTLIDGKIEYEFHQKETHSGKYLDFEAHCSMSTKINIIKSETKRILNNCSQKSLAWPHLEKLKENLISSNYPERLVNHNIIIATKEHENPSPPRPKNPYEYIISIPFIEEAFTRKVKKVMKEIDINARIVTLPGKSIRSLIHQKSTKTCKCTLCENNILCTQRNFVYSAQCKKCNELYIGASRRPAHERFGEHEHSTRKYNDRTTLGQHLLEKHLSSKPLNIPNKVNFQNLLNNYDLKIEKTAKDTLELFLKEHIQLQKVSPKINNYMENGFIR